MNDKQVAEEMRRPITAPTVEQLKNRFTYHAPFGDQVGRYAQIRDKAKELALLIEQLCPGSPERSLAWNALDQAVFLANASIARNEKPGDNPRE